MLRLAAAGLKQTWPDMHLVNVLRELLQCLEFFGINGAFDYRLGSSDSGPLLCVDDSPVHHQRYGAASSICVLGCRDTVVRHA